MRTDLPPGRAYSVAPLAGDDIDAYLTEQENKFILRLITCGSVDDGKSTLIGRLLYDSKQIFDDQLEALEADSRRVGTQGPDIDFALLVDGLAAEREQGITIDVAYRYFSTARRKFIVADCPGHEQYTRNMVTGASTADLALILVDARKGVMVQTRRHSFLCRRLGIRHFVLAVNKMDLVDYDQAQFDAIVTEFNGFARTIGIEQVVAIPVSALRGDHVTTAPSIDIPWYAGPSLIDHLETVSVVGEGNDQLSFRMPVQWVSRPNPDYRGYAGLVSAGGIRRGDPVRVLPSGKTTHVRAIETPNGVSEDAVEGESVTITLADEVDCSRGSVIAAAASPPQIADQFEATLIWLSEDALLPGRGYWLKLATQTVSARVAGPKYEINVNTLEHLAAKTLGLNAIGVAEVTTDRPVIFEPYDISRALGGFILIDKESGATVAAGMLHFSLRRAQNLQWQMTDVSPADHAVLKNQTPCVLWFTGLSGAGKSTIANAVEQRLHSLGRHTFLLDGDNVRHRLNKDLGFTDADRIENIRRVGEVARLMLDAGLIVLAAFISPFRAERQLVRDMMPKGRFVEIYVDTPLAVAEARDVKGLYRRARAGELANFTGIDSPYEVPDGPDLVVDTAEMTPADAVEAIVRHLSTIG